MFKLTLFAVALWLAADPAYAGPVVPVFAAISAVVAKSAILTALVQIGASMVLSKLAARLGPRPKSAEQKTEVKFEIQTGDDLPLSFVVGAYATAGKRKFMGSWGRNTRLISEVIEISALPHPSLDALWIGDEKASIDWSRIGVAAGDKSAVEGIADQPLGGQGSGYNIGHPAQIGSLESKRRIWIKWVDGTQAAADPFLLWAFEGSDQYSWSASAVGRGKCYAIITVLYDKDVLDSYPAYLFQPSPLPMYDPRKDSSTGGSGPHRWGDRATYEPSVNAAVIAYNIARGIYWGGEWVFGGRNLPAWRLPRAAWVAAMTACDRVVSHAEGGSEPAYRCGGEIAVDRPAADVLEDIGSVANMRFAEVGGHLKPCVDLPAAAAFAISDADLIITEGQSFTPFFAVANTFNALSATYPEPEQRWATKDAPERVDEPAMALDGGRYLPASISYPACPYPAQVQRLMVSQLRNYRRMRQHTLSLPPDAYALEPLDVISWTSARHGYLDKKFVIEEVTKLAGFNVTLALREVDPADYDWSPSLQLPWVITPPVHVIPMPQGIEGWTAVPVLLAGNDGKGRKAAIQVSCGGNEIGVSEIRIQVERGDAVQFDLTRPYGAPYQWTLTDVVPETTYRVRGALISQRTGRYEWSAWITLTTPAVSVWMEDLADEVTKSFENIASSFGFQTVAALPAAGARPDQIVFNSADNSIYRWDADAGAWTSKIYVGIPDASITAEKFSTGIEPVANISGTTLPTTKSTTVITLNGRLYRWNGTAYTSGIVAGDIPNSAITAEKFATGIEPVTNVIDSALPTVKSTTNISWKGGLYTWNGTAYAQATTDWDSLPDTTILARHIGAGQVSALALAAGAVTTAKLAAGAVNAEKLQANSVYARHLLVGDFENMAADASDPTRSAFVASASGSWVILPAAQHPSGQEGAVMLMDGTIGADARSAFSLAQIPLVTDAEYYLSALVRRDGAWNGSDSWTRLRLRLDDRDVTPTSAWLVLKAATANTWTRVEASIKIPAGTRLGTFALRHDATAGKMWLHDVQIRRKGGAEVIIDGSLTADQLAANSVTTAKLAAGAVNASKVEAGSLTVKELAIGDFSNLIPNADLKGMVGWSEYAPSIGTVEPYQGALGAGLLFSKFAGQTAEIGVQTDTYGLMPSQNIWDASVKPGEVLRCTCKVTRLAGASGGNIGLYARFKFADGSYSGNNLGAITSATPLGNTVQISSELAVPTDAVGMSFRPYYGANAASAGGAVAITDMAVRRMNGGDMIVDGAVKATHIEAGAIIADKIAAGAILAPKIAAGAVTADKIAALSIEAVHIKGGAVTGDKIAGETITASKLVKSQNLITHTAQIGELVLTTPLLAPNTISRVINVTRSSGAVGSSPIPSASPYRGGQTETRANMGDYLTGSIWAPYTYDLYFWVTLAGQNIVCNLFRNGDIHSYQGYQFRTSLDTFTPAGQFVNGDCSASMVGVIPGVSGTQSLTIAAAVMANREGHGVSSGSLTMMAVMK